MTDQAIPTEAAEILRGAVVNVRYTSPPERNPFSIAAVEYKNEGDPRARVANVKGNDLLRVGDRVRLYGAWVTDPKWGKQFDFTAMEFDMELDLEGVKRWMAESPEFHGVGPTTAAKVMAAFPDVETFAATIDLGAEAFAQDTGISAKLAETIVEAWNRNRESNQAKTWLMKYGLTNNQTSQLVAKYGASIITIMQEDPYQLVGAIRYFGFKVVDEIAMKIGIEPDAPVRIRAGLRFTISEAANSKGHTCISRQHLMMQARGLLSLDDPNAEDMIREELMNITADADGEQDTSRCLVSFKDANDNEHITSRSFYADESETLAFFGRARDLNPNADRIEAALPEDHTLNAGQHAAFRAVANNRVVCLTGGAGVGKTYTLAAICDAFEATGKMVTLCAPTGKAAKRMTESTGRSASTIHRLLEYNGQNFGRMDPLPGGLIVVDEVSMVDNWLASSFLSYVDLSCTTLLLVGDPNQLPPVGAGHLLRDMIQQELCPIARLTECMRQAGPLKERCNEILNGRYASDSIGEKADNSPWKVFDASTDKSTAAIVLNIVEKGVAHWGYDALTDVQVIAPQKKGACGVKELNRHLQKLIQMQVYGREIPLAKEDTKPPIYVGDKIMCIRNLYGSIQLMNGTQCIVKDIDREDRSMILEADDGREVRMPGKRDTDGNKWTMGDFDLAYACTIHKYQGSDAPCVILVVHKSHKFMHTQNLVYTGATRAKSTLVTVGDRWGRENAARSVDKAHRNTVLFYLAELQNSVAPA